MTLPEFAAERRRLPHGVRSASTESSAARPSAAVVTVGRWDRQTDGRTDDRQLHRPCSAYYEGSVDR